MFGISFDTDFFIENVKIGTKCADFAVSFLIFAIFKKITVKVSELRHLNGCSGESVEIIVQNGYYLHNKY